MPFSESFIRDFSGHALVPAALHGHGRFLLARKKFVPAYLKTYREGCFRAKVEQALDSLRCCRVCPRNCEINRLDNQIGVCRSGRHACVASAFTHFGEEDCLRGWNGSGTVFFGWCNLRCVFCQNFETSQQGDGVELDARQLAAVMLRLQEVGCHNINFVTPEHVVPQILEALELAIGRGLRLPLVYNTSSYDSIESIRLMDGVVDIYMPDFKLWDAQRSARYLVARDYPEAARQVIETMYEQVGDLCVDEDGIALRGVLVRHLVMPGLLEDTRAIMHWIATLSRDTYVNLMDQYYPAWKAKTEPRFSEINRRLAGEELDRAFDSAREAGLWRLDSRWRIVRPKFGSVPLPPNVAA